MEVEVVCLDEGDGEHWRMVDVGDSNAGKVRLGGPGRVGDPSSCLYSHLIVTCDSSSGPPAPSPNSRNELFGSGSSGSGGAACAVPASLAANRYPSPYLPAAGLTLHLIIGGGSTPSNLPPQLPALRTPFWALELWCSVCACYPILIPVWVFSVLGCHTVLSSHPFIDTDRASWAQLSKLN